MGARRGRPRHPDVLTPAESILYFRVDDIQSAYDVLVARGVNFTHVPHLVHRHESGMEEWMAFFTDPDGQPLAIMSQTTPTG